MKPTRRDFLIAGVGATAGAARGESSVPPTPTVPSPPPPITDTHVHFYDPARPQGVPWPSKNDGLLYRTVLPPAYKTESGPSGVTGIIVVEASAWVEDNQWILDLAESNPLIVGFVGHLSPGVAGFSQNLTRFAKNGLFRGIRVTGADIAKAVSQETFMDDLKRLGDADLSMDAIGDSAMIAPHPQVYSKVSTVLRRDVADYKASLDEVWGMFGPDRVMYGSNWPVSENLGTYAEVFQVVREYVVGRGASDAGKYFSKNSRDCYKWMDRS